MSFLIQKYQRKDLILASDDTNLPRPELYYAYEVSHIMEMTFVKCLLIFGNSILARKCAYILTIHYVHNSVTIKYKQAYEHNYSNHN